MAARYRLRGGVTRGPAGATLLLDDLYQEVAAPRVDIVDTGGAGDAFAAVLAYGLINDRSISEILAELGIRRA